MSDAAKDVLTTLIDELRDATTFEEVTLVERIGTRFYQIWSDRARIDFELAVDAAKNRI